MGIQTLYQLGRDVNGDNHCFVRWFNPESRIELVFLGINGNKNRQLFLDRYGFEIPINSSVDMTENQVLKISWRTT